MSQVWVLYHMDLRCILVAMFVNLSHGSALYWSAAMMRTHLFIIQNYWCIANAWLLISDQADSCLKVITSSFKAITYRIPLASCFGGDYLIHKSHHQHVMRPQTQYFPWIPNIEVKILVQISILHIKIQHWSYLLVNECYPLQDTFSLFLVGSGTTFTSCTRCGFSLSPLYYSGEEAMPLVKSEKKRFPRSFSNSLRPYPYS